MRAPDSSTDGQLWFHYRFTSPTGRNRAFHVQLDPDTLGLVARGRAAYPPWTTLKHHQCPPCPLDPASHPRCPVAANLVDVVESFADGTSCEMTDIEIAAAQRTYKKQAPLQDGVSALVGLYMVTSGCPVLDKLRPLVATHVPFASHQETTYRAISMYWLAQFFRRQRGEEPDWSLEGLVKIYEDISVVNRCFHRRIEDIHPGDACLNALFRLDLYAQFTNRLLLKSNLGEIARFFQGYLRPDR
jgi:hypothetical protein